MKREEWLARIRTPIEGAVADRSLSRADLRDLMEEIEDDCQSIRAGLDTDEEAEAKDEL
jgi:hypothetical protein